MGVRVLTVAFDPYAPYGPVVETTTRLATWNVWGRYGNWSARLDGITAELARSNADIVCLEEAWQTPEQIQGNLVGAALDLPHRISTGDWQQDGWTSGVATCSRWPVAHHEVRRLPAGVTGWGQRSTR